MRYLIIPIILLIIIFDSCARPKSERPEPELIVSNKCKYTLQIAAKRYKQRKWDEAARLFKEYIEIGCPGNDTTLVDKAEIYHYWAISYESQGKFDSASIILESGLKLYPDNSILAKRLAFLYNKQNKMNEFLALYEQINTVNENDIDILKNMAVLYRELKLYDNQIEILLKILENKPDYLAAIGDLINAYQQTGRNIEELNEVGMTIPSEKIFESLGYGRELVLGPEKPDPEKIVEELEARFIPYDKPPEPIGGYRTIIKNTIYPENALELRLEGVVIVQAYVDENGNVQQTCILKGMPGTGFDEAAQNALKKTRFKPAKSDGEVVSTWISVPIHFRLGHPPPWVK